MQDKAVVNLHIAYNYVTEAHSNLLRDAEAARSQLRFAAKHLAIVQHENPLAVIDLEDGAVMSFDDVKMASLRLEGALENKPIAAQTDYRRGAEALAKAVSVDESNYETLTELAEMKVRQNRRAEAIGLLHRAIELNPRYMPAVDILNHLENNPKIGVTPIPWGAIIALVCIAFFVLAVASAAASGKGTAEVVAAVIGSLILIGLFVILPIVAVNKGKQKVQQLAERARQNLPDPNYRRPNEL
jgi:tetratricopeptide (TPR) repeat protein